MIRTCAPRWVNFVRTDSSAATVDASHTWASVRSTTTLVEPSGTRAQINNAALEAVRQAVAYGHILVFAPSKLKDRVGAKYDGGTDILRKRAPWLPAL